MIGIYQVKAGGRTQNVSFHPSRGLEIAAEADLIAQDLETAKTDPTMLKKYVRVDLSFVLQLTAPCGSDSPPRWLSLRSDGQVGLSVSEIECSRAEGV